MDEERYTIKVVYRAESMRVVEEQEAKIIPLNVGVGGIGYGIGKAFPGKVITEGKAGGNGSATEMTLSACATCPPTAAPPAMPGATWVEGVGYVLDETIAIGTRIASHVAKAATVAVSVIARAAPYLMMLEFHGDSSPRMLMNNKTADELIPGSVKRSPSYDPRYGGKTMNELDKLAKQGDQVAKGMKKLAQQGQKRLAGKNKTPTRRN